MSSREEQPLVRVQKQVRMCVWPAPDAKIKLDRALSDETNHQFPAFPYSMRSSSRFGTRMR